MVTASPCRPDPMMMLRHNRACVSARYSLLQFSSFILPKRLSFGTISLYTSVYGLATICCCCSSMCSFACFDVLIIPKKQHKCLEYQDSYCFFSFYIEKRGGLFQCPRIKQCAFYLCPILFYNFSRLNMTHKYSYRQPPCMFVSYSNKFFYPSA